MPIDQNSVVLFQYSLAEEGGDELEDNRSTQPMAYLHGHGNILPALEAELAGLEEGDSKVITLGPEKAYGLRKDNANKKVPIKHLMGKYKRLLPGMLVKVNAEHGAINARVIKPGKFMVELDLNHPFAGKTLVFDVSITSIRPATDDEIAHGHAHGEGGHHH